MIYEVNNYLLMIYIKDIILNYKQ